MKLNDKEIKHRQILSIGIDATIQLLALIAPKVMQIMTDEYIPNKNVNKIAFGIVLFIVIPLATVIIRTVYNYLTIKFVRKKGNDYSLKIMENIVYKDMDFFDGKNSIETLSYISKEIVQYVNFYVVELSQFYVQFVVGIIALFEILKINLFLGLVQLLYIPLTVFPTNRIMKNVDQEISVVVQENATINQIKGDTLRAIDMVKSYRLEQKKLGEVDAHNRIINKIWGKVSALDTLSNIWSSGFMTALFTGVSFGLGALLMINNNEISVGQLIAFITYGALFYAAINHIVQTRITQKKQNSEFDTVLSYLSMSGEREENVNKKEFEFKKEIQFKDCTFSYKDGEIVFENLNLVFPAGKWTGIIGASGKGKSTVLDIILRLYKVPDKMVYIDGTDINQIDVFSIRDAIAKVSQDIFLFPGSIKDNLQLANPLASEEEMNSAIHFANLSEYINNLPHGLETDIGEIGKLMSGGERQRLSLAMGILRKKKVLLLDEITSNLDPETEGVITEHIRVLKEQGYTIISVSHKHDFLKYADVIYDFGE